MKQKRSMARVQVHVRMPLLHARSLYSCWQGYQDASAAALCTPDALVQNGRLASARRPNCGAVLLREANQALVLGVVLGRAYAKRLIHTAIDVALEQGLLSREMQLIRALVEI